MKGEHGGAEGVNVRRLHTPKYRSCKIVLDSNWRRLIPLQYYHFESIKFNNRTIFKIFSLPGSVSSGDLNVSAAVASALPSLPVSFISVKHIASEQTTDESICTAVQETASCSSVSVPEFKKVRNQLTVRDGMLFRSYVDPVDGDIILVGCMI